MNKQYGFGAIEVILIVVVLIITGLLGWRLWEAQKDIDSLKKNQATSKTQSMNKKSDKTQVKTETDKEQIAKVVCPNASQKALDFAQKGIEITDSIYARYSGGCAESEAETTSGFNDFLKKTNGTWVIVTGGNGDLDCNKLESENFPASYTQPCGGPTI